MRQVWISVPEGEGKIVQDLAEKYQVKNATMFQAENNDLRMDVVILNVPNKIVGDIVENLKAFDQVNFTLHPQDVFPFPQLKEKIPDQITTVTPRSPIEVWLNGLQSVGSWKGFLGYAIAASILVWIGLFTNRTYLLIGAMLVAPFAGPAMNFALATASGDRDLLWRNLVRYLVSLLLTISVSALLSILFNQGGTTVTMVMISQISFIEVLLPFTAGAVGAHTLSQSENNSLVPGTAVGILVAASLGPPAGLIGMALAISRWDMVLRGIFLLIMQLCAINIAGALVFHYYGQRPENVIMHKARPRVRWVSLLVSGLVLAVMLIWQFASTPNFQRSSRAQRAATVAQQVVHDDPRVELVETNMEFTLPSVDRQNTLLGTIFVERRPETQQPASEIEQDLAQGIQRELLEQGFNVNPLISVTVLNPPTP